MDISKFISISGLSGLFKVIAQGKSGLIVESLADKKRIPVHATNKVIVLENISIYVNNGDTVPLADVLKKMYEKQGGQPAPDPKAASDDDLKKFFGEVLPEYDKEKVHTSDIRKVVLWYNLLQKTDIFTAPVLKGENQEGDKVAPLNIEGTEKSPFRDLGQNQGKHLNPNMNAPKKTIGVRKTGTA